MPQNPVAERNQLLLNQTSACAFCRVSLQPWEASSQRGCLQEPRVGMRARGPAYEGQVLLYSSSQTLWGLTSPTAVHVRLTEAVLNLRVSICRMDSTYNHLFSITCSKYKLVKQFASTCLINNSQMTIEVKDRNNWVWTTMSQNDGALPYRLAFLKCPAPSPSPVTSLNRGWRATLKYQQHTGNAFSDKRERIQLNWSSDTLISIQWNMYTFNSANKNNTSIKVKWMRAWIRSTTL